MTLNNENVKKTSAFLSIFLYIFFYYFIKSSVPFLCVIHIHYSHYILYRRTSTIIYVLISSE